VGRHYGSSNGFSTFRRCVWPSFYADVYKACLEPSQRYGLSNALANMTSPNPNERLTVTLERVSVQVHDVGEDFAPTVLSVLDDLNPFSNHKPAKRTILHEISCQIMPGEMVC
jgi:hypothetical protein